MVEAKNHCILTFPKSITQDLKNYFALLVLTAHRKIQSTDIPKENTIILMKV